MQFPRTGSIGHTNPFCQKPPSFPSIRNHIRITLEIKDVLWKKSYFVSQISRTHHLSKSLIMSLNGNSLLESYLPPYGRGRGKSLNCHISPLKTKVLLNENSYCFRVESTLEKLMLSNNKFSEKSKFSNNSLLKLPQIKATKFIKMNLPLHPQVPRTSKYTKSLFHPIPKKYHLSRL